MGSGYSMALVRAKTNLVQITAMLYSSRSVHPPDICISLPGDLRLIVALNGGNVERAAHRPVSILVLFQMRVRQVDNLLILITVAAISFVRTKL